MAVPERNSPPAALSRREYSLLNALLTRGGRKRSGRCRCEGVRAVRELLAHCGDLVDFVVATERGLKALDRPVKSPRIISEKEFESCAATVNSQGVIAVARLPEPPDTAPAGDYILALDRLGDPGNFGTIARTLLAVGGRELWYTKGSIDPWCDKAIRSGMGSQFALILRRFDTLSELRDTALRSGFPNFFIADPHRGEICFECPDLFSKSVLVIGGEANGATTPPPGARQVIIPMPGNYESLNAAQAATVLLFESVRRRGRFPEQLS